MYSLRIVKGDYGKGDSAQQKELKVPAVFDNKTLLSFMVSLPQFGNH
jgi:hypothetical protein